ncbi:hypothetical protein Tco_0340206 [Tanacetum coccineum]
MGPTYRKGGTNHRRKGGANPHGWSSKQSAKKEGTSENHECRRDDIPFYPKQGSICRSNSHKCASLRETSRKSTVRTVIVELGMLPFTMHYAILYQSEEGPRVIMSEYRDIRRCEQVKRLKELLSEAPLEKTTPDAVQAKAGEITKEQRHKLNEDKKITHVQQKKRGMVPERSAAASKEVEELKNPKSSEKQDIKHG